MAPTEMRIFCSMSPVSLCNASKKKNRKKKAISFCMYRKCMNKISLCTGVQLNSCVFYLASACLLVLYVNAKRSLYPPYTIPPPLPPNPGPKKEKVTYVRLIGIMHRDASQIGLESVVRVEPPRRHNQRIQQVQFIFQN